MQQERMSDDIPRVVMRKRRQPTTTPNSYTLASVAPSPLTQLEELQRLWDSIGVGANGLLTLAELGVVCSHIGLNMQKQELEDLYSKLDSDGDGTVSLAEFHSGLLRFVPPSEIQERPRSFLFVPPTLITDDQADTDVDVDADDEFDADTTHLGSSREDTDGADTDRDRSGSGSASSGVVTHSHSRVLSSEAAEYQMREARRQSPNSPNFPNTDDYGDGIDIDSDAVFGCTRRVNWKTQTLPSKFKQRSNSLQHDRALGLFPHSQTVTAQLRDVTERSSQERGDAWHSNRSLTGSTRRVATIKLFTGLPTDSNGCVRVQRLLKYFDNAEFREGERLLQTLRPAGQIDGTQKMHIDTLTERIEEMFASFLRDDVVLASGARTNPTALGVDERLLLQATLATYRSEMMTARSASEQYASKANKLQTELDEANRRLAVLIKESEERIKEAEKSKENEFTLLSDQHRNQTKQLERKYQLERNDLLTQLDAKRCQLEEESKVWRDAEIKFRHTINDRDKYIKAVEKQLNDLQTSFDELTTTNTKLQTDIERVNKQLQERRFETKATSTREKELLEKVATLEKVNRTLQDKNDELGSKIEELKKMTKARSFTKLHRLRMKASKGDSSKTKGSRDEFAKTASGEKATTRSSSSLFLRLKKHRSKRSQSSNAPSDCDEEELPADDGDGDADGDGCSAFASQSTLCASSSTQHVDEPEHSLLHSLTRLVRRGTDDESRDGGMFVGRLRMICSPVHLQTGIPRSAASSNRASICGSSISSLASAPHSTVRPPAAQGEKAVPCRLTDGNTSTSDLAAIREHAMLMVDAEQQCENVRSGSRPASVIVQELELLKSWQQVLLTENELLKADLAETQQPQQLEAEQRQEVWANAEKHWKRLMHEQAEQLRNAHLIEMERLHRLHRAEVNNLDRLHTERIATLETTVSCLQQRSQTPSIPQQINKVLESSCTQPKLSLVETSHATIYSNPECRLIQCSDPPGKELTLKRDPRKNSPNAPSSSMPQAPPTVGVSTVAEVEKPVSYSSQGQQRQSGITVGGNRSQKAQMVFIQPRVISVPAPPPPPPHSQTVPVRSSVPQTFDRTATIGRKLFPVVIPTAQGENESALLDESIDAQLRKVDDLKLRSFNVAHKFATIGSDWQSKQARRSTKRTSDDTGIGNNNVTTSTGNVARNVSSGNVACNISSGNVACNGSDNTKGNGIGKGNDGVKGNDNGNSNGTGKGDTLSLLILNQHIEIRNQICPHGCETAAKCRDCDCQMPLDVVSRRSSTKKAPAKPITKCDEAQPQLIAAIGRDRSPSHACTSCWKLKFC